MANGMATKIDWVEAKKFYIHNPTKSLADVAEEFGVAETTMRERAAEEGWVKQRQEVLQKADEMVIEKAPETIAQIKERHARIAKTLQGRGLEVIATRKPETFEEARLAVLSGIRLEREALGLNNDEAQNIILQKFSQFSFIFNLKPDELQRFISALDADIQATIDGTSQEAVESGSQGREGQSVEPTTLSGGSVQV